MPQQQNPWITVYSQGKGGVTEVMNVPGGCVIRYEHQIVPSRTGTGIGLSASMVFVPDCHVSDDGELKAGPKPEPTTIPKDYTV